MTESHRKPNYEQKRSQAPQRPSEQQPGPSFQDSGEQVARQNKLLAGMARIFGEALTSQSEEELGRVCLAVAEDVTQSRFGFIGEIDLQTGKLGDIAVSDPGWEACRMADQTGHGNGTSTGFAIQGIYGRVLKDGKSLFTNDIASHSDRIGTPAGHPQLKAFLGVPLTHAGQTIGLIGLANRDGGYGPDQMEAIESLAPAIVQAFLHRRTEEALRKSEERLRLAQNGARVGVWEWQPASGKIIWTEELERLYGYPERTFPGTYKAFSERVHPEDLPNIERLREQALKTRQLLDCSFRICLPSGETRWLNCKASATYDSQGLPERVLGVDVDITDRKRVEMENARLLASATAEKERLSALINSISDEVWLFDTQNRLILANPSGAKELALSGNPGGLPLEQITNGVEIYRLDGSARPMEEAPPTVALKGQSTFQEEIVRTPGSGDLRYRQVNASPVKDAEGKVIGSVCVVRDITDRKRRELHAAFLAEVDRDFAVLSSPDEIMQAVGAKVGEYLKVKACNFCEIDDSRNELTLNIGWQHTGVKNAHRTYQMSEYLSEDFLEASRAGETIVIRDTQVDPRTDAEAYAALEMLAFVSVPFHVNGEWKCLLTVTDTAPRDWRQDEIALFQELANRIFPRIERARAEEALRESEKQLRIVAEERQRHEQELRHVLTHAPAGIYEIDFEGPRFLSVNDYICEYLGYSREELLAMNPFDLLDDTSRQVFAERIASARAGQKIAEAIEYTGKSKDGGRRTALLSIAPRYRDGKISGALVVAHDISERKRAEEALRKNEERFRLAIRATHTMVYDLDTRSLRVNALHGLTDLLGYELAEAELTLQWWNSRIHPEDLSTCHTAFETMHNEPRDHVLHYRVRHKDGRWLWVEDCATPVCDKSGQLARIIGTVMDINQRREAEDALRDSEQRYRTMVETAGEGIAIATPDGKYIYVNQRMADLLGFGVDEILGKSSLDFSFENQQARVLHDRKSLSEGDSIQGEFKFRRKDGSAMWSLYNASPVFNGKGEYFANLAMHSDITERKEAEARLRESQRKYQALIESTSDFIWEMDSRGRYTYCSPQVERLWGLRAPEMIGKTPFDFMPAEYVEMGRETFMQIVRASRPFSELEFCGYAAENRLIHLEVGGVPFFDDDGELLGFRGISRDITARKQSEKALRKANEQLKEADRRKDEFLAMLAHELRNPLAVISSASDILKIPGMPQPEMEKAQRAMSRQLRHIGRLVDDLLDVSRVTRGKIQLQRETVELSKIIETAVEAARQGINAKQHKLYISMTGEKTFVHADPIRLAQVISNILQNAAKYTPSGGEIHVAAESSDHQAIIRVRDDGIGISAELLPFIFDLFVQGDRAPDRGQGGLGIGLTLARSLVEMHGGKIEATSAGLGKGSEFAVRLPLVQPEMPETATQSETEAVDSRRILVVDDNIDAAEMMSVLLQVDGHEIVTAHDGNRAIELAAACPPDVALIDLGMPGMDGYELARRLRQEPLLAGIKLIALTGYGQQEDILRSRHAGFDHHLVKPVDLEALRRLL